MSTEDFLLDSKLNASGEFWKFETSIRPSPQLELLESRRKTSAAKKLQQGRGDQLALNFANEIFCELAHSSDLVSKVAKAMDTSEDLISDIHALEQSECANTAPARRYLFDRAPNFATEVDGAATEFRSRAVRTYCTDTDPTQVRLRVLTPCDDSDVVTVELVWAERPLNLKRPSKSFSLQICDLGAREKAVLECGRHLGIAVDVRVFQGVSTCTLEATHVRAISVAQCDDVFKAMWPTSTQLV